MPKLLGRNFSNTSNSLTLSIPNLVIVRIYEFDSNNLYMKILDEDYESVIKIQKKLFFSFGICYYCLKFTKKITDTRTKE